MRAERARVAKNTIVTVIIAVVAFDMVWMSRVIGRMRGSQCSLADTFSVVRNPNALFLATMNFRDTITLQKTDTGLDLWNTPQGRIWTVHGDHILPFLLAEQQFDIYEPSGHVVRRGDIVLDCGANIGVFTRKALMRGAGLVVAIEPAPRTLEALRNNFAAEIQSGRVVVYPKGVWDQNEELELMISERNQAENRIVAGDAQNAKVRVPLTTIDKIVIELSLPRVDFIKMDIEGAEKRAITGAKETIRKFRPRMSLSSEHLPDDSTAIPALVKSIEPRYSYRTCDCQLIEKRVRSQVLAFDPLK